MEKTPIFQVEMTTPEQWLYLYCSSLNVKMQEGRRIAMFKDCKENECTMHEWEEKGKKVRNKSRMYLENLVAT